MAYLTILLSVVLGLIPEALFFAMFVVRAKDIKGEDKVHFIILCVFLFIVIGMLFSYNIWYYIAIPFCLYVLLYIIHKPTEFIDLFLLTIPFLLLALLGFPCYFLAKLLPASLPPNLTTLLLNRILLFILLSALTPFLNRWYNSYKKLWNIHKGNKIKSITIRNLSILISNIVIIAAYVMLLIRK